MEFIFARWLTFGATMVTCGACVVALLLLPRTGRADTARDDVAADAARIGLIAALLLIPASLIRLADQLLALQSPGDPIFAGLAPLLGSTMWGTGFAAQTAALLLTLAGFLVVRRAPSEPWRWWCAAAGALGLSGTLSLQGHAIGNEANTALAVIADITHVVGAGLWLGTITTIGVMGVAIPNADGVVLPSRVSRADARLRLLVPLVPTAALTGAALLIGSGVVSAVLQLRGVAELWETDWGRYVALKAILATVIVVLGAVNWRRRGPRLQAADGVSPLRRTLLVELGVAALLLLVTALLVVTPLPGE